MTDAKVRVTQDKGGLDVLTADDYLGLIEANRTRLRALNTMLVTVCGMLLSASFVVLFFVVKERAFDIPVIVPMLLFAVTASLGASLVCTVASTLLPSPSAVATKLELLDLLMRVYHREYHWALASVIFLVVGILLFASSLAIFGWISF